jgi:hypothetical protein
MLRESVANHGNDAAHRHTLLEYYRCLAYLEHRFFNKFKLGNLTFKWYCGTKGKKEQEEGGLHRP